MGVRLSKRTQKERNLAVLAVDVLMIRISAGAYRNIMIK